MAGLTRYGATRGGGGPKSIPPPLAPSLGSLPTVGLYPCPVGPIPHPTLCPSPSLPSGSCCPPYAGNTLVSNPLTAIGTFLVNTLQQQLKEARQAGGEELSKQLGQSMAGRRLLQVRTQGLMLGLTDAELNSNCWQHAICWQHMLLFKTLRPCPIQRPYTEQAVGLIADLCFSQLLTLGLTLGWLPTGP